MGVTKTPVCVWSRGGHTHFAQRWLPAHIISRSGGGGLSLLTACHQITHHQIMCLEDGLVVPAVAGRTG